VTKAIIQAVHRRFDDQDLEVARQPVEKSPKDGDRRHAKQERADDEAVVEAAGIPRFGHLFLGVLADVIEAALNAEQLAGHVAEDQREKDDGQLLEDLPERTVQALPRHRESGIDRERSHEDLQGRLVGERKLFGDRQANNAADNNGGGVEDGSDHRVESNTETAKFKVQSFLTQTDSWSFIGIGVTS